MADGESTPSEDELADEIVDEALGEFAGLLPAELLREIHACVADRLVAHPEGRAVLRRAMPDPQMDSSGDVARSEQAASDDAQPDAEEGAG